MYILTAGAVGLCNEGLGVERKGMVFQKWSGAERAGSEGHG